VHLCPSVCLSIYRSLPVWTACLPVCLAATSSPPESQLARSSSQVLVQPMITCNLLDTTLLTAAPRYVEEARSLGNLNNILNEGFKYAAMIYTWRSMARAIPQASGDDEARRGGPQLGVRLAVFLPIASCNSCPSRNVPRRLMCWLVPAPPLVYQYPCPAAVSVGVSVPGCHLPLA